LTNSWFSRLLEKIKAADHRLIFALCVYLILAISALVTLDGFLLAATLLFIVLFAIKTIAHADDEKME
jgi:hypothetical protein